MKKINIYVNSVVRWAAYKKESEYQAWIDYAVANNLWGQPGSYTVEVVDATEEIEQKRLQAEGAKKQDFDAHANSTSNPHFVTKEQVGLGSVDNIAAADLRDRSTHTGSQPASTISDFNEAAQDAVGNALLDSADIDFQYPDINNQITAELTTTGVVAGTYSLVTVDAKGRVTEGSNSGSITRYSYQTDVATSSTSTVYAAVTELTTDSLPTGLYKFYFAALVQSAATQTGFGIRVGAGTATITTNYAKYFIPTTTNLGNTTHQDQVANNTDTTTTTTYGNANTNRVVTGEGVFRVTVAGTVSIQIKSEVNGSAVTLQPDATFIMELV